MYYQYLSKGCQAMAVWPWCVMSARFFKWRMMVWNTCDPGAHALQGSTGAPQPAASVPAFPRLAPRLTSLPAQPSARPHRFYYYVLWYIRIEWDVEKSTDIVSQKFFFFKIFLFPVRISDNKKSDVLQPLKANFDGSRSITSNSVYTMLSIFAEPIKCWHPNITEEKNPKIFSLVLFQG